MDFAVETDGLKALGENLRTCGDNLANALTALEDVEVGTLGTGLLESACIEFQDSWGTGLDKIREATDNLVEGVAASQNVYEQAEDALTQAFGKLADSRNAPEATGEVAR